MVDGIRRDIPPFSFYFFTAYKTRIARRKSSFRTFALSGDRSLIRSDSASLVVYITDSRRIQPSSCPGAQTHSRHIFALKAAAVNISYLASPRATISPEYMPKSQKHSSSPVLEPGNQATSRSMDKQSAPRKIAMPPSSASMNEGKAKLNHILLTPPESTELPRNDSFGSHSDEDVKRDDRSMFCPYDRHQSTDSDQPLFDALSLRKTPITFSTPWNGNGWDRSTQQLPVRLSPVEPRLDHLAAQHRVAFAEQHPTIAPPSQNEYELLADFSRDMRSGVNMHSPVRRPHDGLRSLSLDQHQEQPSTRQYGPWDVDPPKHAPVLVPAIRQRSEEGFSSKEVPSTKKRRLTPALHAQSANRQRVVSPTRRRNTEPGARRSRGGSTGSLSKEAKHNRNRSTKQRYPTNYLDYTDVSPSFETMLEPMEAAERVVQHKVNNPKDLSHDQLRPKLHAAELVVASRLNIGCGDYLLTRRQVLNEFVEYLRGGRKKAWNKTRAQSSSNLDVGKTSQIWTFFKEVGWFEEDLYEKEVQKST